jgi:hypothetical protein
MCLPTSVMMVVRCLGWITFSVAPQLIIKVLNDVVILNDVIGSDHKPILFNLECDLHLPTIVEAELWQLVAVYTGVA